MQTPSIIGVGAITLIVSVVGGGVALLRALESGHLGQIFRPHTIMMLDLSVELVERYNKFNGLYPKDLASAKKYVRDGEIFPDMDLMGPLKLGSRVRHFYYELDDSGQKYHLFGIGLDDEPFTEDDVYPTKEAVDKSDGYEKPNNNA